MARRKTARNRRRKKGDRRPLLLLLAIMVLAVVGAIYFVVRDSKPQPVPARKPAETCAAENAPTSSRAACRS